MKIDKKLIKELVNNLKEFELTELEYQEGQTKIKAKGKLTKIIKKYLPQIIWIKCISEDTYLAIPSIKGNKSQPDILRI